MDALKTALKSLVLVLLVPLCMAVAAPTGACRADDCVPSNSGWHGRWFDGTTLCRWRRTWHGPNAVWTPLNAYYMPRPADPCKYGGYGNECGDDYGCGAAIEGGYVMEGSMGYEDGPVAEYGYSEAPGLQAGLERLGQIPNELGIAGGAPAATARPSR